MTKLRFRRTFWLNRGPPELGTFISSGVTSKRSLHGIIISGWRC